MRILVALSGGVDSSVTAHLLARQGHDLVGVQMSLWMDPRASALAQILPSKCCNPQTRYRAEKVASDLGIPFHRLHLEGDFKAQVVDRYLEQHREGLTPNPCAFCNRDFKFRLLLEKAEEWNCDAVASGHYARLADEKLPNGKTRKVLLEATDKSKDQSYFLYALSQEQLQKILFPLGALRKIEVLKLARDFGVPLSEHYQESQDLCFFPEREPHDFLDRYMNGEMKEGPIINSSGKTLGTHRGLPHYTIGQRRGLRIGGLKVPLEVIAKDVGRNTLVVGTRGENLCTEIFAKDIRWIAGAPPPEPLLCDVRTCYQGIRREAQVHVSGETMTVTFGFPQRRTAPGQSVVCYREEEVLGGGMVCSSSPFPHPCLPPSSSSEAFSRSASCHSSASSR